MSRSSERVDCDFGAESLGPEEHLRCLREEAARKSRAFIVSANALIPEKLEPPQIVFRNPQALTLLIEDWIREGKDGGQLVIAMRDMTDAEVSRIALKI